MPITIKKKEGESAGSLIYRFSKKVQHSGILLETKKRRFHKRNQSNRSRHLSALHRLAKKNEYDKKRKEGLL
ncbi:MAG: 30S ribosomal protein S21 [Candidatus Colwellbacteria bacterium]|jgi:ribosomal protein S21|nr:30S ribosomal protein S21 [Candidatus Colwellbacteria bacterium]MCK9497737.1 30S ribosomal protein S21 [Candidatus Colwellbacteria bacterium]MDD3752695.1 30S ribosomal protein S21 [Candidatus Colwellbacteria bacterium]MDD4818844.1 30S ribosomal protein S21 [Candidatus Colwellbacteria bacterium]